MGRDTTATLYDHGVSLNTSDAIAGSYDRTKDMFTLPSTSVAMVLYYDVTIWVYRDLLEGGVVRKVFYADLCPNFMFALWGVHVMQRLDFLSATEDCLLKKGAVRSKEHRLELRYSQTLSFSEAHWFFFCRYAGASFAIMHHYCADHFIESSKKDRAHTCTHVQLPPGSLLGWRAET